MSFILHQRRQQNFVIHVVINSQGKIKVFRNSSNVKYHGIPNSVTLEPAVLFRIGRMLDRAKLVVGETDITFSILGLGLKGGARGVYISPLDSDEYKVRSESYKNLPSRWYRACRDFCRENPYIAAGVAISAIPFLAGEAVVAAVPALAATLVGRFALHVGQGSLEKFIEKWLTDDPKNLVAKQEQIRHAANELEQALQQKKPITVAEQRLVDSLRSPKLTRSYLNNEVLSIEPRYPNEFYRDRFFSDVNHTCDTMLTSANTAQDADEISQSFNLFMKYLGEANPEIMDALQDPTSNTAMQFSRIYDPISRVYNYHTKISKIAKNSQSEITLELAKQLNIINLGQYLLGLIGLGATIWFGVESQRQFKSMQRKLDEIKTQQTQYYHHLLATIQQCFGELSQQIVEGFADVRKDLNDFKLIFEKNHTTMQVQLTRIEQLLMGTGRETFLYRFKDIQAKAYGTMLSYEEYRSIQLDILPWATIHSSSPLLTGGNIDVKNYSDKDIIALLSERSLSTIIGFLAKRYLKANLPKDLPNLLLYAEAIDLHLDLRRRYVLTHDHPSKHALTFTKHDPKYINNLKEILKVGHDAWQFIKKIQTDLPFWKKLIGDYRDSVTEVLNHYQQPSSSTMVLSGDLANKITARYLELLAFTELAFNFSLTDDPLLQLLFSAGDDKTLHLLSGYDLMAVSSTQTSAMPQVILRLLAELLLNIDLIEAILLQNIQNITEHGKQQCHSTLALALIRLGKFVQERHYYSAESLAQQGLQLPDLSLLPVAKPAVFYLRDNIFHQVKVGNPASVDYCVKIFKVDIQQVNCIGETVLHYASKHGDAELTGFLIKLAVKLDRRDNFGNTALSLAIANDHVETADRLVKAGANVKAADIATARANGNPKMLAVLPMRPTVPELLATGAVRLRKKDIEIKTGPNRTRPWLLENYLVYHDPHSKNLQMYDLERADGAIQNFPPGGIVLPKRSAGRDVCWLEANKLFYCYETCEGQQPTCKFTINVLIYDLNTGTTKPPFSFKVQGGMQHNEIKICVWNNSKIVHYLDVVSGARNLISIVDINTGGIDKQFPLQRNNQLSWIKCHENLLLVFYSGQTLEERVLEVYDLTTRQILHEIKFAVMGNPPYVKQAATHLDFEKQLFYAFDKSGDLVAWNFVTNKEEHIYPTHLKFVQNLTPAFVLRPDCDEIKVFNFLAGGKCEIKIWKTNTKQSEKEYLLTKLNATMLAYNNVVFNADIVRFPTLGPPPYGGPVQFYDTSTGQLLNLGDIAGTILGSWGSLLVTTEAIVPPGDSDSVIRIYELTAPQH